MYIVIMIPRLAEFIFSRIGVRDHPIRVLLFKINKNFPGIQISVYNNPLI